MNINENFSIRNALGHAHDTSATEVLDQDFKRFKIGFYYYFEWVLAHETEVAAIKIG